MTEDEVIEENKRLIEIYNIPKDKCEHICSLADTVFDINELLLEYINHINHINNETF